MIPGELLLASGDIELNAGRATVTVKVANTGDRPIQVGSHYHFYETNAALRFDRKAADGYRRPPPPRAARRVGARHAPPAGTAVRFEPGQDRDVTLVAFAGLRKVYGFQGKVQGPLETP